MLVKILTSMAGSDFVRSPGDICEIEDAEAQRFIDAGFAELAPTSESKAKAKKAKSATENASVK